MGALFREQAVQAKRPQSLGTIRLAVPVSHEVWGLFAAAMTAAIVLWLCLGHYTRREHVTGSLVPEAGLLTMAAPGAGTVVRVAVKPGQHVHAGQTLLTISGDHASAELGDTDAAVARALQQQQAQIRATLAALPRKLPTRPSICNAGSRCSVSRSVSSMRNWRCNARKRWPRRTC